MEQFNPDIRIIAVDQDDVVVMFDTAYHEDSTRAMKTMRLPRKFSELSINVTPFISHGELGDKKEYRGTITLVVKDTSGVESQHTLAEPLLWVEATGRNRKRGANPNPYIFHSTDEVTRSVRAGIANALARALVAYYGKESMMDTVARSPAQNTQPMIDTRGLSMVDRTAPETQSFVGAMPVAANDAAGKKQFYKKLAVAAIATPVLVYSLLWVGGAVFKKNDPIQEAVANAMRQDPKSMQAQVDLTKATLAQMGLDPGKAADVGCLAP